MAETRQKAAPTGAAHKNRCAKAQGNRVEDEKGRKARAALINPEGSWRKRTPGETTKFGLRNALICKARRAITKADATNLINQANAIAPLTAKEMKGITNA